MLVGKLLDDFNFIIMSKATKTLKNQSIKLEIEKKNLGGTNTKMFTVMFLWWWKYK